MATTQAEFLGDSLAEVMERAGEVIDEVPSRGKSVNGDDITNTEVHGELQKLWILTILLER